MKRSRRLRLEGLVTGRISLVLAIIGLIGGGHCSNLPVAPVTADLHLAAPAAVGGAWRVAGRTEVNAVVASATDVNSRVR
jgi:hypothetical protein